MGRLLTQAPSGLTPNTVLQPRWNHAAGPMLTHLAVGELARDSGFPAWRTQVNDVARSEADGRSRAVVVFLVCWRILIGLFAQAA